MIIKKVHYRGDVPEHIVRFSAWLVGVPIDVAGLYIRKYRARYKVCRGGRSAESAWLGPWEGGDKWFVDLEC